MYDYYETFFIAVRFNNIGVALWGWQLRRNM